jgi:hypothetical protein
METLAVVEPQIQNSPVELGFLFDPGGRLITRTTGTPDSAAFAAVLHSDLRGNIITHYHPGGAGFSPQDIMLLADAELAEIRAVAGQEVHSLAYAAGADYPAFKKALLIQLRRARNYREKKDTNRRELLKPANQYGFVFSTTQL